MTRTITSRRDVCALFLFALMCASFSRTGAAASERLCLVVEGQASAVIVIAESPTPAARLASLELQHHVKLITGARLPIVTADAETTGIRVLVGESDATRALGFEAADFEPQEYVIALRPGTLVLMGRDWIDTPKARAEEGRSTNYATLADVRHVIDYAAATEQKAPTADAPRKLELPGLFDDQATCYAVYDFLERCCGVRWYGPTPLNVAVSESPSLHVSGNDIRRSPKMKYREGMGGGWPIVKAQWNNPSPDQLNLYWRRMRVGGERYASNHSMRSYQDRFLKKDPAAPGLFESKHETYFAFGRTGGGGGRQFCYSDQGLEAQLVQDARDFFDGKGIKGLQTAMGDYFNIVPNDNAAWCLCDNCQAALKKDENNRNAGHFNSGTASHYLFDITNRVAREVAKTHPDKYISTLAYHVYAFRPTQFELEPNIAVAPCLQVRNYWAPRIAKHEMDFYKAWVQPGDRPIYLWNYYCFPMEPAVIQGWHCFPGFSARRLGQLIRMYHDDGVRGVFLCGIGEQLDYYLTLRMYDDPTIDPDALVDEFFARYFGAAAEPMNQFFTLIEETYGNAENYPAEVSVEDKQFHQTEEIAWKYLGTEGRMAQLGRFIEKAENAAATDLEKRRVETWKVGVWEYMVEGRRMYVEKQTRNPN
jgi:hypothetical protein